MIAPGWVFDESGGKKRVIENTVQHSGNATKFRSTGKARIQYGNV